MAERTCTMPGCSKAYRARGLCSTHYNQQHQPMRHAKRVTECVVCGAAIVRPVSNRRRHTCSVDCRTLLEFGALGKGDYSWAYDAARRASQAGAEVVDVFDRVEVFERDAWTCYLCAKRLSPDASPFDPMSATVDHVVPMSKGGEHSLSNARTCCLGCNSAKGDLLLGDAA